MLQEYHWQKNGLPKSLNPFEVREVLQECRAIQKEPWCSLNPFEVREVLQVVSLLTYSYANRLNPFEVREVLQENGNR